MDINFAQQFAIALAMTVNLLLAAYVFLKNPRNAANRSFFIFVLGMILWSAGILLLFITKKFFWDKIVFFGGTVMILGLFMLSKTFPDGRKIGAGFWILTIPFLLVFLAIPFGLFIKGMTVLPDGGIKQVSGPLLPLYVLLMIGYVLAGIIFFARRYAELRGPAKLQMRYLFLGAAVFIVAALISDLILPAFGVAEFAAFGPAASVIFIASVVYAVSRYRLMDIEIIFRRGAVFTALFLVTALLFTVGMSYLAKIFPIPLSRFIAALIVALGFIPLKNALESATDKIFFRKRYKFTEAVSALNHILMRYFKLNDILSEVSRHIAGTLKLERIIFIVAEPGGAFAARSAIGVSPQEVVLNRASPLVQYFESIPSAATHTKEFLDRTELERELNNGPARRAFRAFRRGAEADKNEREKLIPVLEELKRLNVFIAAPISYQKKLMGLILLGRKLSDDPFFIQDIRFMDIAVHETAVVMESALNLEKILRLEEAKSEFISVVSHELRSPLAAARWSTELLLEKTAGGRGEIKDLIQAIHQSLRRLNNSLNNLMLALEIIEGKTFLKQESIPFPAEIFDQTIKELKEDALKKDIKIETEFSSEEKAIVEGDAEKLKFILRAVVSNAVIYSPPFSSVKIKTKIERRELNVSVEDGGIGVAPENKEAIFERFFRGEEAKKTNPDGLGLELFIARSFAELHGGKLYLAEKENGAKYGSCFRLSLPVKSVKRPS